MTTPELPTTHAVELFRRIDAKDLDGIRALFADDPQGIDEITRGWMRGRAAFDAYWAENLPRLSDIRSVVEDGAGRQWGDVLVETFWLRQSYTFDGTRYEIEAPTTMVWHREAGEWKLALIHSLPLPPAE